MPNLKAQTVEIPEPIIKELVELLEYAINDWIRDGDTTATDAELALEDYRNWRALQ